MGYLNRKKKLYRKKNGAKNVGKNGPLFLDGGLEPLVPLVAHKALPSKHKTLHFLIRENEKKRLKVIINDEGI